MKRFKTRTNFIRDSRSHGRSDAALQRSQAIAVKENAPELVSAVASGEMTLKDAAEKAKPKPPSTPKSLSDDQLVDRVTKVFLSFVGQYSDDRVVTAVSLLEHSCHTYLEYE